MITAQRLQVALRQPDLGVENSVEWLAECYGRKHGRIQVALLGVLEHLAGTAADE